MSEPKDKTKGVPKWATGPLRAFLEDQERITRLLHISMRGISMIRATPKVFDALASIDPDEFEQPDAKTRRAQIAEEAQLAQEEVDAGFPLLHAQAVVSLWAGLEAVVRTLVAAWIQNIPDSYQREPLRRLRVRLGEYETLTSEERGFFVVELLEQEVSAALKPGIGRFEALLEPIGLGGTVPDKVRRTLYELSQVRNVIVHRRSIADRRLADQCPWLGVAVGETVVVSHKQYERFSHAALSYALELMQRLRVAFALGHDESLRAAQLDIEKILDHA